MFSEVVRFEMSAPDDIAEFEKALRTASDLHATRLAIVAKVEGAATRNDFARSLTMRAMNDCLARHGFDLDDTQIILSAGSEGLISPGGYLFFQHAGARGSLPGLAFGMARSAPLSPAAMITLAHVEAARDVTQRAMADVGLAPEDVALVLMKSPILLASEAQQVTAERRPYVNSTPLSRAVAALGVGVALGEIAPADIAENMFCRRDDVFARRAMVFSGAETRRCEAIVLGNRPGSKPCVRSGLIEDLIDIDGIARVIAPDASNALASARALVAEGRMMASFFKVGVAADGRVRGRRTTILSSELEPDKQLRAAASGVVGALSGDTRVFVSGGAEHQAPPGGALFAAIIYPED